MNDKRKRVLNIMHSDIITMMGGKKDMLKMFLPLMVSTVALSLLMPLFVTMMPVSMGSICVYMLFNKEIKYHSEKMPCLLPVERKELVNSRFILSYAVYAVVSLIGYIVAVLSQTVFRFFTLMGYDGYALDLAGLFSKRSNGLMTEMGVLNLSYFAAFSFGAIVIANMLRKYFNNSKSVSSELALDRMGKKNFLKGAAILACLFVFWLLIVSGILKLGDIISVLLALFIQLAGAANGLFFGFILLVVTMMFVVYKYISTYLEYEEKEL